MKEYEKPQMEIIELSGAGVFTLNNSPEGDDPVFGDDPIDDDI